MEGKILEVLRRMQDCLTESQLQELKTVLNITLADCEIVEPTAVQVIDQSWCTDLEDFLMSKALEGKSLETITRYRYELKRLLSYVNKAVDSVTAGDISGYMRAYKSVRRVSNQTLQNV